MRREKEGRGGRKRRGRWEKKGGRREKKGIRGCRGRMSGREK